MRCLFHVDKSLVKSLSLQPDRHHNCQCLWFISQAGALLPLMFHCPANSPQHCSKQPWCVSKQCLISRNPGVHQQLKMPEPKVRIRFVRWGSQGILMCTGQSHDSTTCTQINSRSGEQVWMGSNASIRIYANNLERVAAQFLINPFACTCYARLLPSYPSPASIPLF